jgi:Flp pilus assembly protein TadD
LIWRAVRLGRRDLRPERRSAIAVGVALFGFIEACGGTSGQQAETPASVGSAVEATAPAATDPNAAASMAGAVPAPIGVAAAPSPSAASAPVAAAAPAPGLPPRSGPTGLVAGGLARGTDEPADKELLAGDHDYRAGDIPGAKKHYEAAKKLAPKDPAPKVGLVRARFASGEVPTDYASGRNNPKVKALLAEVDAALRKDTDYGPLHVERGRLLLVLGKADAALAALERGAALSPGDPEGQSALGVALLATGKSDQALERLKRASELDPDDPDRLTNLGTALMMRGSVAEAIVAYRRAVDLAPKDPRALSDLGTALLSANRVKDARPYLEKAVELAPEKATFLSNLGYAQHQLGDVPGAVATFKKAIDKDPKLGSAWINLGNAYADDGKLDDAERSFKKAAELDPTDPRPKANLKDLAELRKARGTQQAK